MEPELVIMIGMVIKVALLLLLLKESRETRKKSEALLAALRQTLDAVQGALE